MKQPRFALAAAFALALAACSPPAEPPADASPGASGGPVVEPAAAGAPAAASGAPYAPTEALLAADGVMFPNPGGRGTGLEVTIGREQAEVVATLTQFRGAAPTITENRECGAGPITFATWGDGLQLHFQNGTMVGWSAGERTPRGFATLTGIGVGSPLIDVRTAHPGVAIETTSLGAEFAIDNVYGIASGTGPADRVSNLWAGISCNFR